MKLYGQPSVDPLFRSLPAVSLFTGPKSVGKWTAAETLREHYGIQEEDVMRVRSLNVRTAELLEAFMASHASSSPFKMAIVQTWASSRKAQDKLLKALEEVTSTRIIFISDEEVSSTLSSRAVRVPFTFLSDTDVQQILRTKGNIGEAAAKKASERSGGQVFRAFDSLKSSPEARDVVKVISLIASHDTDSVSKLARRWTTEHTSAIMQACREKITGRFRAYSETDLEDLPKELALRILTEVRETDRTQYIVKSRLMSYASGR